MPVLFYTLCRGLLEGNEKGLLRSKPFPYTPKRFRTAVAGMKIPSPGPLDDRGVLCEDKYRILLNNVKGGLIIFFEGAGSFYTLCRGCKKDRLFSRSFYTLYRGLLEGIKKELVKRFRTAVAGMKIPSPGPLDDRGVLCAPNIDVYRKLSRVFV